MHVAGAFSCIEIVDTIYHDLMRDGDIFIMSKGHGCMAQYVLLEDQGKINLDDYCKGPIGAHPDLHVPGIAAATGSLGHGLGMAVGMAYADQEHTIYVLLSDGECMEGSTWEAALLANSLGLSNLQAFVDYNRMHSSGDIRFSIYDLRAKFAAFGWDAREASGHSATSIVVYGTAFEPTKHPKGVICYTTKGEPISFMRNNPIWHYRSPTPSEYQQALTELA